MTHDIVSQIDALITDRDALHVHREWENADSLWKDAMKSGDPVDILSTATELRIAKERKDDVFDVLARKAMDLSESCEVIENYDKNTLGTSTKVGEVEELSVEWHEMRRFGMGGSSVSEALGFHWKSRNGYIVTMDAEELNQHWYSLASQKSCPVTDAHIPTKGVLFRGHAWEPALIIRYALSTGSRVAVSKATWGGDIPYQRINTDGIILNDAGEPIGLLECKTSSREWTWNWGVPVHYRAQVLWYLNATGLEYADLLVKFDSGTIDCHRIYANDTIDGTRGTGTLDSYLDEMDYRWSLLESWRDNPEILYSLSSTLMKQCDQVLGSCTPGGDLDLTPLIGGEIIKTHIASPYERMPDYDRVYRLETPSHSWDISGISPVFYPVPVVTGKTHKLDDVIGDTTLLCVDGSTYDYLTDTYGPEGVCNLSALRRMSMNLPGMQDLSSVAEAQEWLSSVGMK